MAGDLLIAIVEYTPKPCSIFTKAPIMKHFQLRSEGSRGNLLLRLEPIGLAKLSGARRSVMES